LLNKFSNHITSTLFFFLKSPYCETSELNRLFFEQVLRPKLIKHCFPHLPNTQRARKTLSTDSSLTRPGATASEHFRNHSLDWTRSAKSDHDRGSVFRNLSTRIWEDWNAVACVLL